MNRKSYSQCLSRALDAMGLSYECIKQRQKSWKICGEHLTEEQDLNQTVIIAGSKAEGITRIYEGDYDLMVSLDNFVCFGTTEDLENNDVAKELSAIKCNFEEVVERSHLEFETKPKAFQPISGINLESSQLDPESYRYDSTVEDTSFVQNEVKSSKSENNSPVWNTAEGDVGRCKAVFLMENKGVYPGYTMLVLKYIDEMTLRNSGVIEYAALSNAMTSFKGLCVLSSSRFAEKAYEVAEDEYTETIAGPAGRSVADETLGYLCDIDSVFCIPCVFGRINQSWLKRDRKSEWPSEELVKLISTMNGHVVPVGFKGSETSHLEWRICYTEAEIELIRALNETQLKVHALMKIIAKNILQSICPDITSYIVKNIVLWMAEKIPLKHFIIDNMYSLLIVALKFLRHSIKKRQLPNYMIPERNLFSGKIHEDERTEVLKVLKELANSQRPLIQIHPQLGSLSKFMFIASNDIALVDYLKTNTLQIEMIFEKQWRLVWEDHPKSFLAVCIKGCTCLQTMKVLSDVLNVGSGTKKEILEKVFVSLTGMSIGLFSDDEEDEDVDDEEEDEDDEENYGLDPDSRDRNRDLYHKEDRKLTTCQTLYDRRLH